MRDYKKETKTRFTLIASIRPGDTYLKRSICYKSPYSLFQRYPCERFSSNCIAMALTLFNDPFMNEMDRAMNRMLTSFGMPTSRTTATSNWPMDVFRPFTTGTTSSVATMPMDIIETPTAFELHADTPGMTPEDVKVEVRTTLARRLCRLWATVGSLRP
jgi:hypothetical protein